MSLDNQLEAILPIGGLDLFTRAYAEAALWTGELDDCDFSDFAQAAIARVKTDCQRFFDANLELINSAPDGYGYEHAGHDFWLTRNGHGAGFWDGDLPENLGDKLTAAAKEFGECWLYEGDDGKLYIG